MSRYERRFPVPPVCTAGWGPEDWQRWEDRYGVTVDTEPDELQFLGHTWTKTNERNRRGEVLYRRKEVNR